MDDRPEDAVDLEPFLLDRWLAQYQFASPPIRYDLAASTGPKWTLDEVLELGGEDARAQLGKLRLSYAPPNGGIDLRTAIANCHGVDPESVVVTTGASEALAVVFCLMAEPGANVVLPSLVFPAIPVLARGGTTCGATSYLATRDSSIARIGY